MWIARARKTASTEHAQLTFFNMVARTTQSTDAMPNGRSGNGAQVSVKEAQAISTTPRHPRKEPNTPKPAQDAELKDYVGLNEHPNRKTYSLITSSNSGIVLGKGPSDLSLGHLTWELGRQ